MDSDPPDGGDRHLPPYAAELAAQLRHGVPVSPPPGIRTHRWTIDGTVTRETPSHGGAAIGTRLLTVAALSAPLAAGLATGQLTVADLYTAAISLVTPLVVVVGLLVVLTALGRGVLGFIAAVVAQVVALTASAARATIGAHRHLRANSRGGDSRTLILRTDAGDDVRVTVARAVDIPIGTTVTIYGPQWGGYRHAWLVRCHQLDRRPMPTRGVLTASTAAAVGAFLTVTVLAAAVATALQGIW